MRPSRPIPRRGPHRGPLSFWAQKREKAKENHKEHKDAQGAQGKRREEKGGGGAGKGRKGKRRKAGRGKGGGGRERKEDWGVWGAAPRPGRGWAPPAPAMARPADVPDRAAVGGGQEVQEVHEIQERPCGATDEAAQPSLQPSFSASCVRQHALNLQPICGICGFSLVVLPAVAGPQICPNLRFPAACRCVPTLPVSREGRVDGGDCPRRIARTLCVFAEKGARPSLQASNLPRFLSIFRLRGRPGWGRLWGRKAGSEMKR